MEINKTTSRLIDEAMNFYSWTDTFSGFLLKKKKKCLQKIKITN